MVKIYFFHLLFAKSLASEKRLNQPLPNGQSMQRVELQSKLDASHPHIYRRSVFLLSFLFFLSSGLFCVFFVLVSYLRPVRGCTSGGCDTAAAAWAAACAAAAEAGLICLGLLTFVLLLANSSLIVWGRSGSKRTPCWN